MIVFSLVSTVFDVLAFGMLLLVFAPGAELFRMGVSCYPFSPHWL